MQSYSQDEMLTVLYHHTKSLLRDQVSHTMQTDLYCSTNFSCPLCTECFRYQWNTHGIVSFLDNRDRYSIALANFAAWDEYAERITDELAHSPVAGALDSAVVTPQLAPVDAYP